MRIAFSPEETFGVEEVAKLQPPDGADAAFEKCCYFFCGEKKVRVRTYFADWFILRLHDVRLRTRNGRIERGRRGVSWNPGKRRTVILHRLHIDNTIS